MAGTGLSEALLAGSKASLSGMTSRWPWPDLPDERDRRVALSYRRLAERLAAGAVPDPAGALADLDRHWQGLGVPWLLSPLSEPLDLDAWLTAGDMGELLGLDPQRLRDWARRGRIRVARFQVAGARHYCVGDVVAYQRERRQRTA